MALSNKKCEHLEGITIKHSSNDASCKDCLAVGDEWVHLRMCVECGYIGCCDSSKNKHARKHFQSYDHPVIVSAEVGESWAWCYIDELFLKLEQ